MSKDEAIGKLVRLAEQCDERSIVRLCNEVEETLEIGPYGVCTWTDPRLAETVARPAEEHAFDCALAPEEPAPELAAPEPAPWEVVAACTAS